MEYLNYALGLSWSRCQMKADIYLFFWLRPFPRILLSFHPKINVNQEKKHKKIERSSPNPEGPRNCIQSHFVEERNKGVGDEREDSLECAQHREGSPDLIRLHELCDWGPGQRRDRVPEHPEDVGQVEEGEVRVEGDTELGLGDDVADDGKDDDGRVAPLEHTAVHWNYEDLKI